MSIEIKLYTRTGCHLCEDMEAALPEIAGELGLNTEIIPIDNDANLEQAYGTRVPVLVIGDEIICEYYLDKEALVKAIAQHQ